MSNIKNNDLTDGLLYGDIQKITKLTTLSYLTVHRWLREEEFRKKASTKTGEAIMNAYEKVFNDNKKNRESTDKRLTRLLNDQSI